MRGTDSARAADVTRHLLVEQGVPSSMIWIEDRSLSTYQNALYSAQLLRARNIQRIVLVTEAYHMLRAQKAFRKQGLSVIPAPCAFRSADFDRRWTELIPSANAIHENEMTLHEWVGLLWYWISRKT